MIYSHTFHTTLKINLSPYLSPRIVLYCSFFNANQMNCACDIPKVIEIYSFQIVNEKSIHVPVSAYPKSFIQWPVDGSTKNKRIAEVKKQVWSTVVLPYSKRTMVLYIEYLDLHW